MDAGKITAIITDVRDTSNVILGVVGNVDPQVAPEAAVAGELLVLVSDLATKAIQAYAAAKGIEITEEAILELLPNANPLTPPTA